MKRLFLIGGLPGSGKTTLAELLAQEMAGQTVAADDYFETPNGYRFDPQGLPTAHTWCQNQVRNWMDDDTDDTDTIIVHNTFSRRWEKQPYLDLAIEYGYEVTEITVTTSLTDEELAVRNVHGVPAAVIHRMRERWER